MEFRVKPYYLRDCILIDNAAQIRLSFNRVIKEPRIYEGFGLNLMGITQR